MILLNYSHPLSSKAEAQLREYYEFAEVGLPCQIDFDAPIETQLYALAQQGLRLVRPGERILYVPPSLSFAAAYVTKALVASGVTLDMVVLKADSGAIRQYMLAEVVEM